MAAASSSRSSLACGSHGVGALKQQQQLLRPVRPQRTAHTCLNSSGAALPVVGRVSSALANRLQLQKQLQQPLPPMPQQQQPTSVAFAKHLAVVASDRQPSSSRLESLGWLLFEARRLQAAALPPGTPPGDAAAWAATPASLAALEQIYTVGAALADLGAVDLAVGSGTAAAASNGARAVASMDYQRLLQRYLTAHGPLLDEGLIAALAPHDELQARAIHLACSLETRSTVHALLYERLLERVGTESWGSSSGSSGPLATSITNTIITQQHSAPVSNAAAQADNSSRAHAASSAAATAPAAARGVGLLGWVSHLGAVFLVLCTLAGKLVHAVIAVACFGRDLVVQLLMLRAFSASARALATGGAAAGTAPAGAASGRLQPALAAAGADSGAAAAGSYYPIAALPMQPSPPRQRPAAVSQLQQQPWRLEAAVPAVVVAWAPEPAPQQQQQQQQQQEQQQQQGLRPVATAQHVLQRITSTAGSLPAAALRRLQPPQQTLLAGGPPAAGSQQQRRQQLLYSLWMPVDADFEALPAGEWGSGAGPRLAMASAEDW